MVTREKGSGLCIAMLGQKGFPVVWGGVEHHVTELASGLVRRGHRVTVFVRPSYQREVRAWGLVAPEGVRVRQLPSVRTKHLDALTHTVLGTIAAAREFDVLHYHAIGPGAVIPLARFLAPRSAKILTIHALDWKRAKWRPWAKRLLRLGESVGVRRADARIAVSTEIRRYLRDRYRVEARTIPNGMHPPQLRPPGQYLASLGLSPARYLLFVGRLVPEKGVHLLLEAFRRIPGDVRLAVVGPAQDAAYGRELEAAALLDPRVVLSGVVRGDELSELYSNAGAFVLPSAVEGFPLSLLEALSYGLPVVASDIPSVKETFLRLGAENVLFFEAGNVAQLEKQLRRLGSPGPVPAGDRIVVPTWDDVVGETEEVYVNAVNRLRSRPRRN